MADIDDMDDIEDLLEAPYKTAEKVMDEITKTPVEENQTEVRIFFLLKSQKFFSN